MKYDRNFRKTFLFLILASKSFVSLHPLYVISGGKCVACHIAFSIYKSTKKL